MRKRTTIIPAIDAPDTRDRERKIKNPRWLGTKVWMSGTLSERLYQNLLDDAVTAPARNSRRKKIVRPEDMPWEMSRQGLLKHLLNEQMNTRMETVDAYMQVIPPGSRSYLMWAAINRPDRFISLMSRVAPKQVFADVTHSILTQAETEAQLRERGLPVELLEHLRKAPVIRDLDEDDDPYRLNDDVTSQEPQSDSTRNE
jgi:hypothetical protein